jgi:transcriptional regulator with XRE-family HTH domain
MNEVLTAATRLREIRESAQVGVREIARRLGMPPSSYMHYENPERFKGAFLPQQLATEIAKALEAEGQSDAILALAAIGAQPGLSDPGPQPRIDIGALIDGKDKTAFVKNTANDELNKVMLALVGDRVQVAGTYDREGIDKLISRLEAVKDLLD